MLYETKLISVGCTRNANASSWSRDGLAAFAAHNMVCLFDPLNWQGGAKRTLLGHEDRVNVIEFIHKTDKNKVEAVGIISGSADGSVILWKKDENNEWGLTDIIKDSVESIVAVSVTQCPYEPKDLYVASSSADGNVRIYKEVKDKLIEFQVIQMRTNYAISLSISEIPYKNVPIIACASVDCKVNIFTLERETFEFKVSLPGHSNWVRQCSFAVISSNDDYQLLLATASQDKYIRIWKLSSKLVQHYNLNQRTVTSMQLSTQAHVIMILDLQFVFLMDSLLIGHDDWVYSARWMNPIIEENSFKQPLCLISASSDKSLILWSFDEDLCAWNSVSRVGEVGGLALGFYQGMFSPTNSHVLGQSYNGSFSLWKLQDNNLNPLLCIGGHNEEVRGLVWSSDNSMIATVSSDQTTRIYGKWQKNDIWCEIARPQIHGYDMQSVTFINDFLIASAGDEKVVRIFAAPKSFIRSFGALQGFDSEVIKSLEDKTNVIGANVPALGLSNKAIVQGKVDQGISAHSDQRFQTHFTSLELKSFEALDKPPLEYELATSTLWPEVDKLYGHGYEVYSVASSPDMKLLATACKATNVDHASIRIWTTTDYKTIQVLTAHSLTVTKLSFSPCNRYLLSVSRDRQWYLFEQSEPGHFVIKAKQKAHARIIWSCAWGDSYFVTVSRDKKLKTWSIEGNCIATMEFEYPVTSVSVMHPLIAVGQENGSIQIVKYENDSLSLWLPFDARDYHGGFISSLAFGKKEEDSVLLASCSHDHSVRIYKIHL